ncbi:MAG: hypothetical protein J5854_07500 [Clostridia bacterium]|nr:hypothetical protein [Clostridia bacterium]
MNNDEILKAIGDIDRSYVDEAKPRGKRRFVRAVSTAAAALILVAGLGIVLPKIIGNTPDDKADRTAYATPDTKGADGSQYGDAKNAPVDPPETFGGMKGTVPGFSISLVTLAEAASRHEFIAAVRINGKADADRYSPVDVTECFAGSLPESILVRFPIAGDVIMANEYNRTVADVVLERGGECIVFLDRMTDGTDRFFAAEIIWHESDGSARTLSIRDIEGSTYSAIITALPGVIRDNPYKAPIE